MKTPGGDLFCAFNALLLFDLEVTKGSFSGRGKGWLKGNSSIHQQSSVISKGQPVPKLAMLDARAKTRCRCLFTS